MQDMAQNWGKAQSNLHAQWLFSYSEATIITDNVMTDDVKVKIAYYSCNVNLLLRILQGGVASGMNHVTEDLSPKLYLIKGKRQPIIRQLSEVGWKVMNDGDCFVLDVTAARGAIFVWSGKHANRLEKLQAAKVEHETK